ncbi:MAG TPA: caspase family protein [Candidatus Angelobacter sp.]|jgi:hypothetical protein|nr:caspase family protein [Candidatus Angelobacter sp.]
MNSRYALVIGNTEYEDQKLARLRSPSSDVNDFSRVLEDQQLGGFDHVVKLVNQPKSVIERRISALFAEKHLDDLVLLYFSGHGIRDEEGQLYLAVGDTEHNDLDGTAIIASFIARVMNKSLSRRQILILDCCHSGAFSSGFKGTKGEGLAVGMTVGTKSVFETPGYGRIILTASDATQYAWEGEEVIGEAENSLYTHFLIKGIKSGEADRYGTGKITVDELHNYAYQQVLAHTSKQRPQRFGAKEEGQLVLSRAPIKIAELPHELRQALSNGLPRIRQAAISDLLDLVRTGVPGQILAAHSALNALLVDDSFSVRRAAAEALASYTAADCAVDESVLDRAATEARSRSEHEQSIHAQTEQAEKQRLDREQAELAEKQRLEREQAELVEKRRLDREQAELVEKQHLDHEQAELAEKQGLTREQEQVREGSVPGGKEDLILGSVVFAILLVVIIISIWVSR